MCVITLNETEGGEEYYYPSLCNVIMICKVERIRKSHSSRTYGHAAIVIHLPFNCHTWFSSILFFIFTDWIR